MLEREVGADGLQVLLDDMAFEALPDGSEMIDETEAARFHRLVGRFFPRRRHDLARSAGEATAEYIIEHRIPGFARRWLERLPTVLAERLLCRAITSHAWTFAGSGTFRHVSSTPVVFVIEGNPLALGDAPGHSCDWHAAVFRRLFERLIGGGYSIIETHCGANGDAGCRFEIHRRND